MIHALLLSILVSGIVIEGARLAVTELNTPLAYWSPVGLLVAKTLSNLGEQALRSLHANLWWLHLLLAVSFIAAIPFSKLRHIFTTSANYLFSDLGPPGKLTSIDLEDESAVSFGAAKIADLSWKDIFDGDACTRWNRPRSTVTLWG